MESVSAATIEISKHGLKTSIDNAQKKFFLSYFASKSGKDIEGIMNFWSPKWKHIQMLFSVEAFVLW